MLERFMFSSSQPLHTVGCQPANFSKPANFFFASPGFPTPLARTAGVKKQQVHFSFCLQMPMAQAAMCYRTRQREPEIYCFDRKVSEHHSLTLP
jgi:hypothetical protein